MELKLLKKSLEIRKFLRTKVEFKKPTCLDGVLLLRKGIFNDNVNFKVDVPQIFEGVLMFHSVKTHWCNLGEKKEENVNFDFFFCPECTTVPSLNVRIPLKNTVNFKGI